MSDTLKRDRWLQLHAHLNDGTVHADVAVAAVRFAMTAIWNQMSDVDRAYAVAMTTPPSSISGDDTEPMEIGDLP